MTERFPQTVGAGETDVGLRNFMLGTYRWMALAMAVAGVVSYFVTNYLLANQELLYRLANSKIMSIVFIVGIMIGFAMVGRKINTMSKTAVAAFLFAMAGVLGAVLSVSFAVLSVIMGNGAMVQLATKVFFMTVAMFGALSLFGYSTQMNLTTAAKFAAAVLIGIIAMFIAARFGLFEIGTGLSLGLSIVGVIVVGVLIAWETQALKSIYYGTAGVGNTELLNKMSIFGAASLLLSFFNMFQFLLNIMSILEE